MKTDKSRHTVWLSDEAWNQVSLHYREDNCTFQNEYIEKAILFYSGYLDAQNASAYLPRILSDVLEGKLDALGSRMGRLLFKLAVEQNMTANILASEINAGLDEVEKLRIRCVREVKQINGEIKFEDALKYQKGLD
ncbi:hypothetical protein [Acutalibacter muris]|jgi:hypothetical protein|uniref:hypothetical protein n=1 Tax=Acutalibacter muris TaxID=1796620 RepID=UPI00272A2053|nr:hypothetical protein [Acutalibacter muris]